MNSKKQEILDLLDPGETIRFHGGCHGCTQQTINDIFFCKKCQMFDTNWDKPDLNNRPPDKDEVIKKLMREL